MAEDVLMRNDLLQFIKTHTGHVDMKTDPHLWYGLFLLCQHIISTDIQLIDK